VKLGHVLKSVIGLLRERSHHDELDMTRDIAPGAGKRRHRLSQMAQQDRLRVWSGEWRRSSEHLVEDTSYRVDISPCVRLPIEILGRHVGWSTDHHSGGCKSLRGVVHRSRNTEVHHDRVSAGQHDVRRLDVPVKDIALVRVAERTHDFGRDGQRMTHAKPLFPRESLGESLAVEKRHDVVQHAVRFTGVDEGKDVRMLKPCRDGNLAEETLSSHRCCDFRPHHLDRDRSIMFQVDGAINDCHPSRTEFTFDEVVAGQCGTKVFRCRHVASRGM
jgi:hypothetical protein